MWVTCFLLSGSLQYPIVMTGENFRQSVCTLVIRCTSWFPSLQMIWCQERGRTAKCRRSVASSCYFAPSTCCSQLFCGSSPFLSQVRNMWLILLYHLASVVDPKLYFPYTDPVPTLLCTFVSGSGLFFKYSFLKPNFIFFFVLKSSRTNRKTRYLIKGLLINQIMSERHDSFTVHS